MEAELLEAQEDFLHHDSNIHHNKSTGFNGAVEATEALLSKNFVHLFPFWHPQQDFLSPNHSEKLKLQNFNKEYSSSWDIKLTSFN